MTDGPQENVVDYFRKSCSTLMRATEDRDLIASTTAIVDTVTRAFRSGGKVLIAGNGGSAADAQHIAGEFLSRLNFDRNPLPAIALTTDTSVLTAIGNCSASALATSIARMNCTGTDFGRNSGVEIVARKTTLPSSA